MRHVFRKLEYKLEGFLNLSLNGPPQVPTFPIIAVSAVDPDIGDDRLDQNITYYLDPSSWRSQYFDVDKRTGDVRIVKPLDRDLPDGFPNWPVYIYAKDEGGGPNGLENFVELNVELTDVNDNAPFLDMGDGLVWPEERGPGEIGLLHADDYDTPAENGPPFRFEMAGDGFSEVKQWFEVGQAGDEVGSAVLRALVTFDREKRKTYQVPINVCDNKGLCDVDYLTVTIGDINDNPMDPGHSDIFVYNFEGRAPDTPIGRVFVDDPDDWDLPDKTFRVAPGAEEHFENGNFRLDRDTGTITMRRGIHLPEKINRFSLEFRVEDPVHGQTGASAVAATVNVTVQKIPREAVMKSGSVRIRGRPEDFVVPDVAGQSKKDKFKALMSEYLNTTHVDVFTVMPSSHHGKGKEQFTDIRFSAHGSPYYQPERLEGVLTRRRTDLERSLGVEVAMIHIDECMYEGVNCEGSCLNTLRIEDDPVAVFTNRTSFVGVRAFAEPICGCVDRARGPARSCDPNPCLNGGVCHDVLTGGYSCDCPADNPEFFGQGECQRLAASFNGEGWSWHRGLEACGNSHVGMWFNTQAESGTVLYVGPSPLNVVENVTDFLALELEGGKLKMLFNFGSGTRSLVLDQRVSFKWYMLGIADQYCC